MITLPNMTVISPSDDIQTKWMIQTISQIEGPVYVRLARLATPIIYEENQKFNDKNVRRNQRIGKKISTNHVTDWICNNFIYSCN